MNGHTLQAYIKLAEARHELEIMTMINILEDDYEKVIDGLSKEILDLQDKVYKMYLYYEKKEDK